MPLNIRTYHDLTEADASGLPEQIGAQRLRVAERVGRIRRVIAVMSGKGGVGKSFVTAHLARALARAGQSVGVLDADLNGPTAARLLEAGGARLVIVDDAVLPATGADGVRLISTDLLLEDGQPLAFHGPKTDRFVWRGAMEAAALREFLSDVAWGTLDVLLIDLPPGLGRFEELADLLGEAPEVLTVTIPTTESRDAVRRALRAAIERGAPVLGVVENMVGGTFVGTAGDDIGREFGIPVLARIPWNPTARVWDALASNWETGS
jgi:ATP-binding protein involved in chromosome partitioning